MERSISQVCITCLFIIIKILKFWISMKITKMIMFKKNVIYTVKFNLIFNMAYTTILILINKDNILYIVTPLISVIKHHMVFKNNYPLKYL